MTHLQTDGIERAFDEGPTTSEILGGLQISSVLAGHSFVLGAKILDGKMNLSDEIDDESEALLDD